MKMKRSNKIYILNAIFFLLFFAQSININAQCSPETYSLNCIEKLKEEYIYLKSYNVDGLNGNKDKIEYTVVLSKNTDYLLNICTASNDVDGIILRIYDSDRKQVVSNNLNDVVDSEIEFNCTHTGIYYLTFTFLDSKRFCGGCTLAFKK
jgi:hypothetical protein